MEKLRFDRKCKCDFCGHIEICSITHYGTTNYNRLICLECACSINCSHHIPLFGAPYFDLNNSTIIFRGENFYDYSKDYEDEESVEYLGD